MATKDLNKCAQLLTDMLNRDPDPKGKKKPSAMKGRPRVVSSAMCKNNKERKGRVVGKRNTGSNVKGQRSQSATSKQRTGSSKEKKTGNAKTASGPLDSGVDSSSNGSIDIINKANAPTALNDSEQVKKFQPIKEPPPQPQLYAPTNMTTTRTPYNKRLVASTPLVSPVSITKAHQPIRWNQPPLMELLKTGSAHVGGAPTLVGSVPVSNFSMYSSSSNGENFNQGLQPQPMQPFRPHCVTGLKYGDFQLPTRDTEPEPLYDVGRYSSEFVRPVTPPTVVQSVSPVKEKSLSSAQAVYTQSAQLFKPPASYGGHKAPQTSGTVFGSQVVKQPVQKQDMLHSVPPGGGAVSSQTSDVKSATLESIPERDILNCSTDETGPKSVKHVQFNEQNSETEREKSGDVSLKLKQPEVVEKGVQYSLDEDVNSHTNAKTGDEVKSLQHTGVNTSCDFVKMDNKACEGDRMDNRDSGVLMDQGGESDSLSQEEENMTSTDDVSENGCNTNSTSVSVLFSDPKSKEHISTIQILFKKLRTAAKKDDKESRVGKLLCEVEREFGMLVPGNNASLQWQTELNMALQPIRSENAQLRRRVRILNQQLGEKERIERGMSRADPDFEVVHLQLLNHNLQEQLKSAATVQQRLVQENSLLRQELQKMATEKQEMLQFLSNRDADYLKYQQDWLQEVKECKTQIQKIGQEKSKVEGQLNAKEHQLHMANISLMQKQKEMDKLQELVKSLQQSMTRLLHDLESSRPDPHQVPWQPTMENLTQVKHMLNASEFERNDLESELQGQWMSRSVRSHDSQKTQEPSTNTSPNKVVRTAAVPKSEHTPIKQQQHQQSFAERVSAALNSLPKPYFGSGNTSKTSDLTTTALEEHNKQHGGKLSVKKKVNTYTGREQQLSGGLSDKQNSSAAPPDQVLRDVNICAAQYQAADTMFHEEISGSESMQEPAIAGSEPEKRCVTDVAAAAHPVPPLEDGELFYEDDGAEETQYLHIPGFEQPQNRKESTGEDTEASGPTVRDLLSSLATRWQKSASENVTTPRSSSPKKPGKSGLPLPRIPAESFTQSWPPRHSLDKNNDTTHNETAPSIEQSRYSVTDYFRKYQGAQMMVENGAATKVTAAKLTDTNTSCKFTDIEESLSTIGETESDSGCTTTSVGTVDEVAFREGLAKLDANIAEIQANLRKPLNL